jgi:hypothetical protein
MVVAQNVLIPARFVLTVGHLIATLLVYFHRVRRARERGSVWRMGCWRWV